MRELAERCAAEDHPTPDDPEARLVAKVLGGRLWSDGDWNWCWKAEHPPTAPGFLFIGKDSPEWRALVRVCGQLQAARADALEEAADLCERRAEGLPKGGEAREQAVALAFVIRDLKERKT